MCHGSSGYFFPLALWLHPDTRPAQSFSKLAHSPRDHEQLDRLSKPVQDDLISSLQACQSITGLCQALSRVVSDIFLPPSKALIITFSISLVNLDERTKGVVLNPGPRGPLFFLYPIGSHNMVHLPLVVCEKVSTPDYLEELWKKKI